MPSRSKLTLLLAPLLLITGCAARGPAPMTQVASPCDRVWQLGDAAQVVLDSVRPQQLRMDRSRRCGFRHDGSVATYVALRLPEFERPWILELQSLIDDQRLFAPEVLALDEQGHILREVPLDRFVMRGDRLQAHLFFREENAGERYLLLRSAPQAVGRSEQQVVSGSFFVPLINTVLPILYVQGTEGERRYTYSHDGLVQVEARSLEPPRGQPSRHELARSELGQFLR